MEQLHRERVSYWCVLFSLLSNSHVSAGQSWQWKDAGSHMEAAVSLGETGRAHTHTHMCSLPKPTELSSILKLFPETKAVPNYRYKAPHYIFGQIDIRHTPGMHNNSVPYLFFFSSNYTSPIFTF